jgi:hypothetical protein
MPETVLTLRTPNSKAPTPEPISAAGISSLSRPRSLSRHRRWMPKPSITSSSGSMIAAACGTGITSASKGTASEPKPPRKPLLDKPISSTAGTATA